MQNQLCGSRLWRLDNFAWVLLLNSVEKRAAIETGQEQENVNLTGQISAKSIALSKVMSLEELEALEKEMAAAMAHLLYNGHQQAALHIYSRWIVTTLDFD